MSDSEWLGEWVAELMGFVTSVRPMRWSISEDEDGASLEVDVYPSVVQVDGARMWDGDVSIDAGAIEDMFDGPSEDEDVSVVVTRQRVQFVGQVAGEEVVLVVHMEAPDWAEAE